MKPMEFLGSALVVVSVVVLVTLIQILFNRSIKKASSNSFPYHRQLLTFAIVLLGLFLAIGFLPIEHEVKGQILSVLGVLLSAVIALSSTTLVGNAMAGIMLRMMHEFRAGDFIEIENMVGRVTDFGIFHTEIQTITRDVVSIPNLLLVNKAVKVTRRGGTFINIGVSIGYDVPHGSVEEALKKAAQTVGLKDPFVFVEKLLDHAVQYRVYGLLEEFTERLSKTSDLHKTVLDTLHAQEIEIASPSVMDRREFPSEHRYIPKHIETAKMDAKESTAIEEMAFDKAEEAESIEQLRKEEQKLVKKLEELDEQEADGDKEKIKQKRDQFQQKIERIQEEVASREEKKEEKKEAGE
ncbi:mechanosensitive ion channel domain-containing protein [Pleomorphochaeta sp. DL1XJH-081]|uniref:mechanosensitive ion channel family protein n=1 Tax=Pleomorphochaeta sp. DL1XJH-081 TaxID=3409690 RepID=UPI003BB5AB97